MANENMQHTMSASVDLDVAGAVKSFKTLTSAVKASTSEWKANESAARHAGDYQKAQETRVAGLTKSVQLQQAALADLKKRQSEVDISTEKGTATYYKLGGEIANAGKKLDGMTSQLETAKGKLGYYTSGLSDLQKGYQQSTKLSESYVTRLQAEGKQDEANTEKLKNYQSGVTNLTKQLSIQQSELDKLASATGKSSDAYKLQQERVNNTATDLAKAKTQMNELSESMNKANPSFFDKLKNKLTGVDSKAKDTKTSIADIAKGSAIGNMASNWISNLGSDLANAAKQGFQLTIAGEETQKRWSNLGLATSKVKELSSEVGEIRGKSDASGASITELQKSLYSLTGSVSITTKLTNELFSFGRAAGMGNDQIGEFGSKLTRVFSASKVNLSTFNRSFAELPGLKTAIQKASGMTADGFKQALSNGKITGKQLESYMVEASSGSGKAWDDFGKSSTGKIDKLKGSWTNMTALFMKPIATGALSGINSVLKSITDKNGDLNSTGRKLQGIVQNLSQKIGSGIANTLKFIADHHKGIEMTASALLSLAAALKAVQIVSSFQKISQGAQAIQGAKSVEGAEISQGFRAKAAGLSNTAVGGLISTAGYTGTAYNIGGDAIKSVAGKASNRGSNIGGTVGAAGLGGLGFIAGNALLPGIGGALGAWAGSSAGKFIGEKLGKSIQIGLNGTPVKPKISTNISGQTKKLEDALQKGVNSFNKKVLIKINADPNNLDKSKKEVKSALSDMYKANADYYDKKKKQAKKDIEQEVANGEISEKQARSKLKDAYKIYDDRKVAHKKLISSMESATNSYYSEVNKIQSDSGKSQAEKQKEILKAHKEYVDKMVRDEMRLGTTGNKQAKNAAKEQESIYEKLTHRKRQLSVADYNATIKEANKLYDAAVKPARKQRDVIIDAAKEQYEKTTNAAGRQYKDLHTISKKQYDAIVKNARQQRDDTDSAAKDQYKRNTKTADKERDKTVSTAQNMRISTVGQYKVRTVDTDKEMAAAKRANTKTAASEASGIKSSAHSGAKGSTSWWNDMGKSLHGIMSGIGKFFDPILKAFGQQSFTVSTYSPGLPEFAKGTGLGNVGRYTKALVGELGAEMRFNPTKGTADLLGVNGPEIRSLEPDDHILTAEDTKKLTMPSFASGTDSIFGFAKKVWDSAASKIEEVSKNITSVLSHPIKSVEGWFTSLMDKFSLGKPGTLMSKLGKGMVAKAEKGVKDTIEKIADVFSEDVGGGANPKGSGVLRWRGTVEKALRAAGLPASSAYVGAWLRQIATESSGNPHAVQGNIGDINNITGDLARGLVQTTSSTFAQYGHGSIYNGFDDLLAGIKYALARYGRSGMLEVIGHGHGYANGGWANQASIFGESGLELAVPMNNTNRAITLLGQAVNVLRAKTGMTAEAETGSVSESKIDLMINLLSQLVQGQSQPTYAVISDNSVFKAVKDHQLNRQQFKQQFGI